MSGEILSAGSIPLDTPQEVFETFGAPPGKYLLAMPDGEVGPRRHWISCVHYQLPTSVDVMSAIGGTVVKVGHHPIVTTKRRASSAAFKCSISSNMPLTTTPFLNAMKPRWTPWPQHADLTPGKKPIHGSHPSVFCS